MAKRRHQASAQAAPARKPPVLWLVWAGLVLVVAGLVAFNRKPPNPTPVAANASSSTHPPTNALSKIEVNQALMVTVELDFGGKIPSIAEALREIERRHQPDAGAGSGRVFAILDGYGEPTADGKKLHLSMHLSMEKPGIGSLIFKRTGETLWSGQVVPTTNAPSPLAGRNLTVLFDNGSGKLLTVDGSKNPTSILDATLKESGQLLRDAWADGTEAEITYIYSACGCPVKVRCRRTGDRTVRAKEMPVIFPDDPAVVEVITRLMRW